MWHSWTVPLSALLLSAADAPLPSLDVVRAAYLEAVTSLHTVDCRYHIRSELTEHLRKNPTGYRDPEIHLTWKGNRRAEQRTYRVEQEGKTTTHWYGFDGKHYAEWGNQLHDANAQDVLHGGLITPEKSNALYMPDTIEAGMGLSLGANYAPLTTLFQNPGNELIGWDDVHGIRCVHVRFASHAVSPRRPQGREGETSAWFDPAWSYLPRRIECYRTDGDKVPPGIFRFEAVEYARILGGDREEHLFPAKVRYENPVLVEHLELESVHINGTLSDDVFRPVFPDLTQVRDYTHGRPPRIFYVGDGVKYDRIVDADRRAQYEEYQRSQSLQQPAESKTSPQPVIESPSPASPQQSARFGSLHIVSVICLVIVVGWFLYPRLTRFSR